MNGMSDVTHCDVKSDLLPHKYRPKTIDKYKCHYDQAQRLKSWIQEFLDVSKGHITANDHDSSGSDSNISEASDCQQAATKCVLITGPPGVGKTSLVYTVANELKLHVVESHSSEKRDFKLFSMLKLTNQKGKINPIAKLFQAAQQQQQQRLSSRRKKRKLTDSSADNKPQPLSLSGDTSIVLFDDIDVVFEEDGPFLKSLVEFIQESKRPVILTATQSIDHIKSVLVLSEHIHLDRPDIDSCVEILKDVCRREKCHKISKTKSCRKIAKDSECDIRQCLNRIHFYGEQADSFTIEDYDSDLIVPKFTQLNLNDCENVLENNKHLLDCYQNNSLIDLMSYTFEYADRSTLLQRWLDGKPSGRNEEYSFNHDLGNQLMKSITELSRNLYTSDLMTSDELGQQRAAFIESRSEATEVGQRINQRINSRIEPPERDFYTDIVPVVGQSIQMELQRKETGQKPEGFGSRRSNRLLSYLDSIQVYLDPIDKAFISETMLSKE